MNVTLPARDARCRRRRISALAAVCCLAIMVGCSKGPGYPTATVSGTVSIGGRPVPKGFITFNPAQTGPVTGSAIENGSYRCEGVPAGKHTVTFQAQGDTPSRLYDAVAKVEREVPTDILPAKYRQGVPTEIEAGNVERNFNLD